MASWKSIRITKPCKISIDKGNLLIQDSENNFKLSLADTDSVIFEGDQFVLTAPVLSAFAKHKIATLFCDKAYMPQAILLPYSQSALGVDVLKVQIKTPKEFKEKLWQLIIEAKILNQYEVLHYFSYEKNYLQKYIGKVALGDKYNVEAKSAREYWNKLFKGLKREQSSFDVRNQALNYGYAILRSMLARDLSVAGFNCALGIWHDNKFNPYNLVDDLIEPFRPLVDVAIKKLLENYKSEFISSNLKRQIINIFDWEYISYMEAKSSIRKITKLYINDFKKAIFLKDVLKLNFPTLLPKSLNECF